MTEFRDPLRFFEDFRNEVDDALRQYVAPGTPVALVGYPDLWNAGDPAIWLGARAMLTRLACPVTYLCDFMGYDPDVLRRRNGDGPILINGGGNLGDLWKLAQPFRERLIADFPRSLIIQLPQSVHFQRRENLRRFQSLIAAHPKLVIMLRDRFSYEFARENFDATTVLVPDLALSLGPLSVDRGVSTRPSGIVFLRRTDQESTGYTLPTVMPDVQVLDWVRPADDEFGMRNHALALKATLEPLVARARDAAAPAGDMERIDEIFQELGWLRVRRGLMLLSRGLVSISDRLHGHVLALCLGQPHVVLDNSYHKVRGVFETWSFRSRTTHWASSPEDALARARALVSGHPMTTGEVL